MNKQKCPMYDFLHEHSESFGCELPKAEDISIMVQDKGINPIIHLELYRDEFEKVKQQIKDDFLSKEYA